MIKLVCFVRRKPGLDRAAFHAHWLENHGALIAGIPSLRDRVARYEQNHRLDFDYEREDERDDAGEGYDGATIMWFESMADYDGFATDPLYAEKISPDEASFMDRSVTLYFFTGEEDVKIGGAAEQAEASLKLLALLRRRPDLTAEQFHAHWSGPHARLFQNEPALREHILAYQQNHRLAEDYTRDPATAWDGLAEQWYASLEDFQAGPGGRPFEQIVIPDEERFIDRPATRFILTGPPDVLF